MPSRAVCVCICAQENMGCVTLLMILALIQLRHGNGWRTRLDDLEIDTGIRCIGNKTEWIVKVEDDYTRRKIRILHGRELRISRVLVSRNQTSPIPLSNAIVYVTRVNLWHLPLHKNLRRLIQTYYVSAGWYEIAANGLHIFTGSTGSSNYIVY